MTLPITKAERKKYERIWGIDQYEEMSPGLVIAPYFERMMKPKAGDRIIDIGCGKGAASRWLRDHGYDVMAFDLVNVINADEIGVPFFQGSIWRGLRPFRSPGFKYGFCVDVMEHLPTQMVSLAVSEMIEVCRHLFLSISFNPDVFGSRIGEPLHLTVRPFAWWRDTLREIGYVIDARDRMGSGVFHVSR